MQPIELYKLLPKKNCGECSAATCMAFAVQSLKGMVSLSDCPELDDDTIKEIESQLDSGPLLTDWKEKRIQELLHDISHINLAEIADNIGARLDADALNIHFLGTEVCVSPSGFRGDPSVWARLLTLVYIKHSGNGLPEGKWVNFRDLRGGSIKAEAFHNECELPIAGKFEADAVGLVEKLSSLGAVEVQGFSSDVSLTFQALPKIPLLILLWKPDDEFGADCKVLFDPSAVDYLDVESLCYLGDELVRILK